MKFVIAVIKPSRLEHVREALNALNVLGMTATEVKGYGRQKGHSEIYRGAEYEVHFLPKIKLEIALDDGQLDATINAIREAAGTGKIGDGKIFVLDLEQAVRIRTGESGTTAL
ncbi:MAG: P-II family nitrogen regulator [Alphaproteobacteria bacterium]|nr:P-II family nitrogen regulator [Alphaproteobacteria bacterium]